MYIFKSFVFALLIILFFSCKKEEEHREKAAIPFATAGTNQSDIEEFQVTLNADSLKAGQTGKWSIVKGLVESKVNFSNDTRPDSKFNGMPGEIYELKWTVMTGSSKFSESIVKINFKPLSTTITNSSPDNQTQFFLNAKIYDRGTWSIEGKYATLRTQNFGGTVVPDLNSPNIKFQAYANTNYKITWTTSYGSKTASATFDVKSGNYLEVEALNDLKVDQSSYRVGYENGHIVKLDLSSSGISWILQDTIQYPALQAFKYLKELHLERSSTSSFPVVIGEKYRDLEYLNLDDTRISTIASNVGKLTKLKQFMVSHTQYGAKIYYLPESMGDLENLEYLVMGAIGLQELPESMSKLKKLRYFDCNNNPVQKLPTNVGSMESLESLFINTNEGLPPSIAKLSKLRRLYFTTTATHTALPADFGNLQSLDTLDLSGQYRELPASFGNLNLRQCNLSTPELSSVPESFGNLKKLESLQLYGVYKSLPNSFSNLSNLKYLTAAGSFEYLPKDFGNLTNLVYFNGQSGSIKELPESIGNLSKLTELRLDGNQITSLPSGLFNLPKITRLTLSYNKIGNLPDDFLKLGNTLRELYLYGNNYSLASGIRLKGLMTRTSVYVNLF